jgi:SAM-dependent methyltransferase
MLNRSTGRWAATGALMLLTPVVGVGIALAVLKCFHRPIPSDDLPLGVALIGMSLNYVANALNRRPQPQTTWTTFMQSPSVTVPLATVAAVLCAWFLDGQQIALFAAIGLSTAALFANRVLPKFSPELPTSNVGPNFDEKMVAAFTVVLLALSALGIGRLRIESHDLLLLTSAGFTTVLIVIAILLVRIELVAAAMAPIVFSVALALGALGLAGIEITRYNSIFILFLLGLTTDYSVNILWSRLEAFRGRSSTNLPSLKLGVIITACLLVSTVFASLRPATLIGLIVVASSLIATLLLSPPITNWLLPTNSHRPAPSLSNSRGAKSLYNYLDIDAEQYVTWKLRLDPIFKGIDSAVPPIGQILDAGCGYGQMSNSLALKSSQRTVIGVDRDQRKIEVARCAARTLSNARFELGDLLEWQYPPSDCVLLIDVLHYWNPEKQEQIIAKAAGCLCEKGILIFREGLASKSLAHRLVHFGERWSTWTGQNRRGDGLFFQDRDFYLKNFQRHGLSLQKEVPEWGPCSNSVLILHRPSGA